MNEYEFIFLLEEEEKKIIEKVEKALSQNEGKITKKDKWGKKSLAYPIKQAKDAHFFCWMVQLPPNKLNSLKLSLNLMEDLVRYLILKQQ